ncbi:MAG TPA: phage BR0599 family protein [Rhizobium sp.]|nr:phage BR0599 family protein [Rhizobium sp.]
MSFESREISNQDGLRIALYEIEWGETKWYYTSADKDLTFDIPVDVGTETRTYKAVAISDSGMTQGGSNNNDITVSAPSNIPLRDLFASTPPSLEIWLTIRRAHYGDTDPPLIYWSGTITNVKPQEGNAGIDIVGKTLLASFGRSGLRLAWTRGCPHMLYDQDCGVDRELHARTGTISALTGNSVTVTFDDPAPVAGWFDGGFIQWEASLEGTVDRRGIVSSPLDNKFIIFGTTYRLAVGMEVKLYPGCDLATGTCLNKFDNLANYGGFEQMTGKNPFDGTAII